MKMPNHSDWQQRRSEFNHLWLKNRFLNALDSLANLLSGRIRGAEYLEEVIQAEIKEWPERYLGLQSILGDFEQEMSPRKAFEYPPLCDWETQTKATVADLIHTQWLIRYPVAKWLETARQAGDDVDAAYHRLIELSVAKSESDGGPRFAAQFDAFREACRRLSKAIEVLPDEIIVI